jgi:hypothetical protein
LLRHDDKLLPVNTLLWPGQHFVLWPGQHLVLRPSQYFVLRSGSHHQLLRSNQLMLWTVQRMLRAAGQPSLAYARSQQLLLRPDHSVLRIGSDRRTGNGADCRTAQSSGYAVSKRRAG